MPSVSKRQARAMRAAASGHSTIGIQKSVGKEYVAADRSKNLGKYLHAKKGK